MVRSQLTTPPPPPLQCCVRLSWSDWYQQEDGWWQEPTAVCRQQPREDHWEAWYGCTTFLLCGEHVYPQCSVEGEVLIRVHPGKMICPLSTVTLAHMHLQVWFLFHFFPSPFFGWENIGGLAVFFSCVGSSIFLSVFTPLDGLRTGTVFVLVVVRWNGCRQVWLTLTLCVCVCVCVCGVVWCGVCGGLNGCLLLLFQPLPPDVLFTAVGRSL